MSRTHTAPWDYQQRPPTLAVLQETKFQCLYFMIVNRLERDYGIDKVANIVKSWGDISYNKKLELAEKLELELDTIAELKDACGCVLPEHSCWACDALAEYETTEEIPF